MTLVRFNAPVSLKKDPWPRKGSESDRCTITCMYSSRSYIESQWKLPRPTAFSLNRRLWDFLCNWAFMICCEVSVARLRTLGIHENIWPWHGGESAFLRTQIRYRLVMKLLTFTCVISDDCRDVLFVCVCLFLYFVFFCGHHWFHLFLGKGSRQAGETNVFYSVSQFGTNVFPRKSTKTLVAPFWYGLFHMDHPKRPQDTFVIFCDCLSGLGLSGWSDYIICIS